PAGRDFPAVEFQIGMDATSRSLAEAMQAMWQRTLGVAVTLSQADSKTQLHNAQTANYQIDLGGWTADYAEADNFLSMFVTHAAMNWSGWSNPRYDALVTEARTILDPARR